MVPRSSPPYRGRALAVDRSQVVGGGGRSTKERQTARRRRGVAVPRQDGREVTVKNFLKRAWYSPALLVVLVYVLGAPRKWPGK